MPSDNVVSDFPAAQHVLFIVHQGRNTSFAQEQAQATRGIEVPISAQRSRDACPSMANPWKTITVSSVAWRKLTAPLKVGSAKSAKLVLRYGRRRGMNGAISCDGRGILDSSASKATRLRFYVPQAVKHFENHSTPRNFSQTLGVRVQTKNK